MVELQVVLPDESASMPPERLVELAVAAEDLGYGTAWLPDHLLPPGEFGSTYGGVYEPLVTIGYLAARTSRIRFGTSVLVLPMRSPMWSPSRRRRCTGCPASASYWESARGGRRPSSRRSARCSRSVAAVRTSRSAIIRDLFEGRDRGGVFEPKLRAPLPLMIGGTTGPALRRAARYGDEWQGLGLDGAGFAAAVSRLRSFGDRPIRSGRGSTGPAAIPIRSSHPLTSSSTRAPRRWRCPSATSGLRWTG